MLKKIWYKLFPKKPLIHLATSRPESLWIDNNGQKDDYITIDLYIKGQTRFYKVKPEKYIPQFNRSKYKSHLDFWVTTGEIEDVEHIFHWLMSQQDLRRHLVKEIMSNDG